MLQCYSEDWRLSVLFTLYNLLNWDLNSGILMHFEDVKFQCLSGLVGVVWYMNRLTFFNIENKGPITTTCADNFKKEGWPISCLFLFFWREMKARFKTIHSETFQIQNDMVLFFNTVCLCIFLIKNADDRSEVVDLGTLIIRECFPRHDCSQVLILNSIFNAYWTTLVKYIIRRSTVFLFSSFLHFISLYAIFLAL